MGNHDDNVRLAMIAINDKIAEYDPKALGREQFESTLLCGNAGDKGSIQANITEKARQANRVSSAIQQLEEALSRLESGEWDLTCVDCGTDIPINRIVAVPGTDLCVECKGAREKLSH